MCRLRPFLFVSFYMCYVVDNSRVHAEGSDNLAGAIISIRRVQTNMDIGITTVLTMCLCSIFLNYPLHVVLARNILRDNAYTCYTPTITGRVAICQVKIGVWFHQLLGVIRNNGRDRGVDAGRWGACAVRVLFSLSTR